MKFMIRILLFVFFGFVFNNLNAQSKEEPKIIPDSVSALNLKAVKKHFPRKATMYSAVLPGLGQIYNKQSWKVPFIYGGFAGIGYGINYYNQYYKDFKQAYLDIDDGNPETNSYYDLLPEGSEVDESSSSSISNYKSLFLTNVGKSSQQRDRFIIGAVAFYLFNILDANVNAHFLDFDISEDLTLNVQPISTNPATNAPLPGLTLVFNF